ncbi:MAG: hypothetical protein ACD_56C00037G0008 [uncultured bacterium]|nr:MAG: hypothetical protein ACD_56C00037G0008 [uncultured bacterium]
MTKTIMKLRLSMFLFLLISGFFLTFGVQKVLADTCSAKNPGSACVDKNKVSGESGCVANLCPGTGNSVQCCAISSVTCNADGSSIMQPCSAAGNYGVCNAAGTCVDSNSGPIPSPATANPGTVQPASGGGTAFTNPLKFQTVDQFLSQIMGALQGIIVTLSLLMIVIGAVMYVISGGGKQIETAKNMITAALVGLAIGLAAPSFLKEISTILGWGTTDTRLAAALSLSQIATRVLNFLLGILGILSLVMMVIGASMYLTSAGDEDRIDTGKNIFKYSLLGVVIAMASMVLVTQVAKFFIVG